MAFRNQIDPKYENEISRNCLGPYLGRDDWGPDGEEEVGKVPRLSVFNTYIYEESILRRQ